LTSTDCKTRRARCQHQLSFLLSFITVRSLTSVLMQGKVDEW